MRAIVRSLIEENKLTESVYPERSGIDRFNAAIATAALGTAAYQAVGLSHILNKMPRPERAMRIATYSMKSSALAGLIAAGSQLFALKKQYSASINPNTHTEREEWSRNARLYVEPLVVGVAASIAAAPASALSAIVTRSAVKAFHHLKSKASPLKFGAKLFDRSMIGLAASVHVALFFGALFIDRVIPGSIEQSFKDQLAPARQPE